MNVKHFVVFIVLLLLLLVPALADTPYPEIACEDCSTYFADRGYCDQATNTCILLDEPQTTNTSNTSTENASAQTSQSSATTTSLIAAESNIASLQKAVSDLQQRVNSLEQDYNSVQTSINSLQTQVSQVQIETVKTQLNTISTGLAGLQENLQATKTELQQSIDEKDAINRILMYSFFALLGLAAILGAIYAATRKTKQSASSRQIDPEIAQYITQQIKAGKKYPVIHDALLNVGWDEQDIQQAYTETMKRNYQQYQQKNTAPTQKEKSTPTIDKKKALLLILVSIAVIIGALFILKGISTGKAIQFPSLLDLQNAVQGTLEKRITDNTFYSLLSPTTLCIQVQDGTKAVAFAVQRTATGHSIAPAVKLCTEDPHYDAGVQFMTWQSFDDVSNDPSCENIREKHGKKELFVLPAKLVLPGFEKNPTIDYSQYCPLLRSCLSTAELAVVGC